MEFYQQEHALTGGVGDDAEQEQSPASPMDEIADGLADAFTAAPPPAAQEEEEEELLLLASAMMAKASVAEAPAQLSAVLSRICDTEPLLLQLPPTAAALVESLAAATAAVSAENAAANLACPVCKQLLATAAAVGGTGGRCVSLPSCPCVFHLECIVPWLRSCACCPSCRSELPTDDEQHEERRRSNEAGPAGGLAQHSYEDMYD